jgi:hypothetical protein
VDDGLQRCEYRCEIATFLVTAAGDHRACSFAAKNVDKDPTLLADLEKSVGHAR